MQLIDTHSHLYAEEFDDDRSEALHRAREAGVVRLLLPAIDSESHEHMFALAKSAPDVCRVMMGLHPTSVNDNPRWREELALVEQYLTQSVLQLTPHSAPQSTPQPTLQSEQPHNAIKFCAVGEIGLDFYWSEDFKAEQREAFVEQCRLAARLDLPVAIHTRSAWEDMCEILEQESAAARQRGERLRGVLHAFGEDANTYRRLRQCGDFLFGIGGVVTFKKSCLATTVAEMDIEHIILETDCPYLTPAPHRGKRNESAYVSYICEKVAQIKGLPADEVARITTANAMRMFLPDERL